MSKKFSFYNEINRVLVDVFIAGKEKRAQQPVLDDAHKRIMEIMDKAEVLRLQQVAGESPEIK